MKKLNEWIDANGNKITIPSGNSSTADKKSAGYYQRFIRLVNYHINHKDKDVDKIVTADVRNFGLDYIEHHKGQFEGGYFKKVAVRISDTEDWYFTVNIDNKQIANKVGKCWDKLVYELSFNLNLPQVTSDPEYQELLKEWVDAKGNKVVPGIYPQAIGKLSNRDKFIELTDYLKAHANPNTIKAEVTRIDDSGFTYREVRSIPNVNDITLIINCNHSRFSDAWSCEVFRNQTLVDDELGHGWENLLKFIGSLFNAPTPKDPIYQKLLESISYSTIDDFKNYETLWD